MFLLGPLLPENGVSQTETQSGSAAPQSAHTCAVRDVCLSTAVVHSHRSVSPAFKSTLRPVLVVHREELVYPNRYCCL